MRLLPADGGIRFGQYVLLRRIARGGMAEVFLAQQRGFEGFDRRVAVKRILPHLADSPDFVKMFLGEAKLAAQLTHPNVVHIYDFGKVDTDYFIAMEYVDGVHAGQLFKHSEQERMLPTLVARVGADAAAALHYAHELRATTGKPLALVHRDVSPANLMVSYDGVVKLCDFGIAKAAEMSDQLTNPGQVKGKYAYMSPEQTVAAPLDGRSDVFSLAVVLWELLAGKTIVPRGDAVEAMRAIRDGRLPALGKVAPDVPRSLVDAVHWGLETKRERRATAAELAQALEAFIKASPELATPMQLGNWVKLRFPREVTGSHQAITNAAQLGGGPGTMASPPTRDEPDGTALSDSGTMGEPGTSLTHAVGAAASDPDFDSATLFEPREPVVGTDPRARSITGRVAGPAAYGEGSEASDERATLDDSEADLHETVQQAPHSRRSRGEITADRDTDDQGMSAIRTTYEGVRVRESAGRISGLPLPGRGVAPPSRPSFGPPPKSRPRIPAAMVGLQSGPLGAGGGGIGGSGAHPMPAGGSDRMPADPHGQLAGARAHPFGAPLRGGAIDPEATPLIELAFPNGAPRPSQPGFPHPSGEETIVTPALRAALPTYGDPNLLFPESSVGTQHVRARPLPPRMKLVAALVGIGFCSFVVALASTKSCGSAAPGALRATAGGVVAPLDAAVPLDAAAPLDAAVAAVRPASPDAATRQPTISDTSTATASLVTVNTQPTGGSVTIGAEGARRTPAQFALVPGTYEVTAELDGYQPQHMQLTVTHVDSVFEVVFARRIAEPGTQPSGAPAQAQTGSLTVRTTPYSEVYLGTQKLGETPFAELPLPVGKYTLVFKNPDHATVRRTITIEPGKPTKLLFDLP